MEPNDQPFQFRRPQRLVIGEETLGWVVAGASAMARYWFIPAMRNLPPLPDTGTQYPIMDCNVAGIYSRDEARAQLLADDLRVPHTITSLSDLGRRDNIHCVYVGGHPRHHYEITLAALSAGKHVLVEAPMATTLDDALTMAHTASSRGLVLGVNYFRRADPAIVRVRQMLLNREIGDLVGVRMANMVMLEPRLQTWRLRHHDGGVVLNRSVHDIDLARYLLRDEVEWVHGRNTMNILGTQVEEDVLYHMHMRRSGLTLELHDSFIIPHNSTRMEIYGSIASLVIYNCFEHTLENELCLVQNQHLRPLNVIPADPLQQSISDFVSAVRGHGKPLAAASDAIRTLQVALALRESIQSGAPVHIEETGRRLDDYSVY